MERDWDAERGKLTEKRQAAADRVARLGPETLVPGDAEALLAYSKARLELGAVDLELEAFDAEKAIVRTVGTLR